MKVKTLLSIFLLNMLLVETVTAFHGKTGLLCEECHAMHQTSEPDEGPFAPLLIKESSTELCLTCHNGKPGAPDVIGEDDVNGLVERSAGFFAAVNAPNANGHDLQADNVGLTSLCSTCHSGGRFSTAKIGCIDCHDPHGTDADDPSHSYRNLRSASEPVVANASGTTNEVFCLTCHKAHGAGHKNSLRWPQNSNLGCQQCHNKG